MSEQSENILVIVIWICLLLSAAIANGGAWYWKAKYRKMTKFADEAIAGWQKAADLNTRLLKLVDDALEIQNDNKKGEKQ